MGAKRRTGGGAKRPKLGQVVTATGAKRFEDGCETSWGGGGAKRLWCEMSWSLFNRRPHIGSKLSFFYACVCMYLLLFKYKKILK